MNAAVKGCEIIQLAFHPTTKIPFALSLLSILNTSCVVWKGPPSFASSFSPSGLVSQLFFHFSLLIWPPASSCSRQGNTVESEHLSELTEEEYEAHIYQRQDLKGFMWLDAKYLNPFFTRRLTQEVRDGERDRNPPSHGRPLHHFAGNPLSQLKYSAYGWMMDFSSYKKVPLPNSFDFKTCFIRHFFLAYWYSSTFMHPVTW